MTIYQLGSNQQLALSPCWYVYWFFEGNFNEEEIGAISEMMNSTKLYSLI